jgi:importin subunit beta-1
VLKDPNNHVKDTTGWTLGRIFEFLHGSTFETPIITQANCQQIITVLLQSMKDVPNVAEKACGALYFLAQGFEDTATDVSIDGLTANEINSLQFGANADVSHCTNLKLVTLAELEEGC